MVPWLQVWAGSFFFLYHRPKSKAAMKKTTNMNGMRTMSNTFLVFSAEFVIDLASVQLPGPNTDRACTFT